ncbi:DctQ-like TRAP transporter subunit [Phyllobacterium phragmitis]|uniref:TRAP transporter small permease protein n=1 Tax=Phyllobacterium phragmitis TaxID=2670329 RepID=A0A2S9IWJ0_9HYPH|nr:TRAP transporter small permease [Phyllobacterium phragmitis]PRD44894.1 DctQ-like TRAP transporter subunit [Phyllobacterium phragmitis]
MLWRIYDRVELVLALILLTATVSAVLIAAIGRTLGAPVTSAPQFAQLFLLWTCMFGADLCMRLGEHIRVAALIEMAPHGVQKILSAFLEILVLVFLIWIAWHGFQLAAGNWSRELGASGLSYGVVTLALPVGAVLMTISTLRRIAAKGWGRVFEPDTDAEEYPL